jgi:hypothetical protein
MGLPPQTRKATKQCSVSWLRSARIFRILRLCGEANWKIKLSNFSKRPNKMGISVKTELSNLHTVAVLEAPATQPRMPQAKKPKSKGVAAPDDKISIVVARAVEELKEHLEAWQSLADNAVEPNIFYEPSVMLPAVESFGANTNFYFVFLYAPDPLRPFGAKILCGFFPLEFSRRYKKMPVAVLSLWKHAYCFLCTPLLRAEGASGTLAAFFDWLESKESPAPLMEFCSITGDRAFRKLLTDEVNKRASLTLTTDSFNRALFEPNSSEGISGKHKKELRRQQNRLAEEGLLEYVALEEEADVDDWIDDFLQLEASGWKGQQGSAFALEEMSRKFFETTVKEVFRKNRLMMIALRLNGKPVAMKCNFLSGSGSFAFKIAFDEELARFSPGVLLELENMRRVNAMPQVEWMDSCAVSEHFMINRLWTGRRTIETILVSTGKTPAGFLVSILPMLTWIKRKLSRKGAKP